MKQLYTSLLCLLSTVCFSGTSVPPQKIVDMGTGWNGQDLYITTENREIVEGCNTEDARYVLPDAHPKADYISSMILTAFHSKKDIAIYVDGCHGSREFMKIQALKIHH